jgi:hypothetical protein
LLAEGTAGRCLARTIRKRDCRDRSIRSCKLWPAVFFANCLTLPFLPIKGQKGQAFLYRIPLQWALPPSPQTAVVVLRGCPSSFQILTLSGTVRIASSVGQSGTHASCRGGVQISGPERAPPPRATVGSREAGLGQGKNPCSDTCEGSAHLPAEGYNV